MNSLAKESMNIAVESLKKISETDLADLCNITEQAIRAGGGFGWLTIPPIETLKNYWNGLRYSWEEMKEMFLQCIL